MLKLNASFSKKVPAEEQFSSKSFHAAIEVELPDGLTQQQLQEKIHSTFQLVERSVETEISGEAVTVPQQQQQLPPLVQQPVQQPVQQQAQQSNRRQFSERKGDQPSPKQMKYMLDLGRVRGLTAPDVAAMAGVYSIDDLSRQQCSRIIDDLSGSPRQARAA